MDFMVTRHKWAKNAAVASAAALNAGVDLDLGATYGQPTGLAAAFSAGAVSEATIDRAVKRVMLARVSLGEMDDTATRAADPLSKIGLGAIDAPQSRQLAHDMAVESIVLLQNERREGKAVLPIRLCCPGGASKRKDNAHGNHSKNVLVVGPNANRTMALLSSYYGCTDRAGGDIDPKCKLVTPLAGIEAMAAAASPGKFNVKYVRGWTLTAVTCPSLAPPSPRRRIGRTSLCLWAASSHVKSRGRNARSLRRWTDPATASTSAQGYQGSSCSCCSGSLPQPARTRPWCWLSTQAAP